MPPLDETLVLQSPPVPAAPRCLLNAELSHFCSTEKPQFLQPDLFPHLYYLNPVDFRIGKFLTESNQKVTNKSDS